MNSVQINTRNWTLGVEFAVSLIYVFSPSLYTYVLCFCRIYSMPLHSKRPARSGSFFLFFYCWSIRDRQWRIGLFLRSAEREIVEGDSEEGKNVRLILMRFYLNNWKRTRSRRFSCLRSIRYKYNISSCSWIYLTFLYIFVYM